VTDLTSLVVIRPDEKPSISSLEQTGSSTRSNIHTSSYITGGSNRIVGGFSLNSFSLNRKSYRPQAHPIMALAVHTTYPTSTYMTSTITFRPSTTLRNPTNENDDEAYTFGPNKTIECTGNLTLFSKTYLRGEKVVLDEDTENLEDLSFDNLSVSASVSGSCCWQIFSEKSFSGTETVLTGQGTYTSVSSFGPLFRDVSAVRKYEC